MHALTRVSQIALPKIGQGKSGHIKKCWFQGHVQIQGDIFNLLIFTVIWHFLNIFVIICTMDLLFWHMIDIGMLDIIVKK